MKTYFSGPSVVSQLDIGKVTRGTRTITKKQFIELSIRSISEEEFRQEFRRERWGLLIFELNCCTLKDTTLFLINQVMAYCSTLRTGWDWIKTNRWLSSQRMWWATPHRRWRCWPPPLTVKVSSHIRGWEAEMELRGSSHCAGACPLGAPDIFATRDAARWGSRRSRDSPEEN